MTRIGLGYDIHRLVPGRKLVIGGETIPFDKGLQGHSDADVLVHAACDALLGAVGMGDIGDHFPDTDPRYLNIYSIDLLTAVYRRVNAHGFVLGQHGCDRVCSGAPHIALQSADGCANGR
jgi:2-C-methyl-D-erythritol 2,4-cyclodiphosphate synthase